MGSNYPERPKTLNKQTPTGVRLDTSQKEKLGEYSRKHGIPVSALIREAVTIWLNLNTQGGD
jgi:hypothetical protein